MVALLALSLCPWLPAAHGAEQTDLKEGDFNYRIVDGEAWITGYTGKASDLVTPTMLGGYPVTYIDEYALAYLPVKTLTISEGVRESMKMSYAYCRSLETIRFPSTYKSIYGCAFTGCSSLTNIEVDSRNSTYFSRDGNMYRRVLNGSSTLYFYACGKPEREFTVPSDVTSIWIGFRDTVHLKVLNIGDNVLDIDNSFAFEGDSIETINIGKGLRDIDDWLGCGKGLKAINVSPDNATFCSKDGMLYSKDMKTLYTCPASYPGGTPVVDGRVSEVAHDAFRITENMKSVTFNGKVTTLGGSTFFYCNEESDPLRIRFEKGVDVAGIDESAFWCSNVWLIGDSSVQQAATKANVSYLLGFDVSKASVSGLDNVIYGADVQPTVELGTAELKEGRDYRLALGSRKSRTQTITITGIGDFTGSKSVSFDYIPFDLENSCGVSIETRSTEGVTPTIALVVNGETLVEGVDYTTSYEGFDKTGTAVVTITGKGNYTGTLYKEYLIAGTDDSSSTTEPIPDNSEPDNSTSDTPAGSDSGATNPQPAGTEVMYRLYNPNSGEHFYTSSPVERQAVIDAGWDDEGIGWTAPTEGVKVYRLYNSFAGEHHYTKSEAERDMLVDAGWTWEEGGWYSDVNEAVPLYRAYNPNAYANNHHYTLDWGEFQTLLSLGWKDEGVGWHGVG